MKVINAREALDEGKKGDEPTSKISDLFGISDERFYELAEDFNKLSEDTESFPELLPKVLKLADTRDERDLIMFLFGKAITLNERQPEEVLGSILSRLVARRGRR